MGRTLYRLCTLLSLAMLQVSEIHSLSLCKDSKK